jgi:hypothetical protein
MKETTEVVPALSISAGPRRLRWDGRNERGDAMSAGVYFLHSDVEREILVRRLIKVD